MALNQNRIEQVRPTSTFDSWQTTTADQVELKANMLQLANSLLAQAERIKSETWPFDHARMIILWGKTGRGKTHLIEALINHIKGHDSELLEQIWLARENFTLANIAGGDAYGERPIVIIDDLWAEHDSMNELHCSPEIKVFNEFVRMIYEERRLVILTSNFPLTRGILEKVQDADKTGRIFSRLQELVAHSGEIEVTGSDYREKLAQADAGRSPFNV